MDFLLQDDDLSGLVFKNRTDRTMKIAEQNVAQQETMEEFVERLQAKQNLVLYLNAGVPAALFLFLGVFVWLARQKKKKIFLASL